METKTCSMCHEAKSLNDFHNNKAARDGKTSRCKVCASAATRKWYAENLEWARGSSARSRKNNPDAYWRRYYKREYGITLDQYNEMLEVQGGVCAICGNTCQTRSRLAVDHDHETGKVRGLLCNGCNRGIGLLNDSPELLRAAIGYLTAS